MLFTATLSGYSTTVIPKSYLPDSYIMIAISKNSTWLTKY